MLETLLRRARRRYIGNQFLAQGAYAASAGMAGVILLLIAGTQILDWPWLVGIIAVTLGLGVYRTLRRVPPAYTIAQLIDQRMLLADALSTAFHFSRVGSGGPESVLESQRAQAELLAARVDLERAVPFAMPRAAYVLAALGLVASGLFAVRYGFSRSLNLRAPLARILMESFGGAPDERAALRKDSRTPRPDAPKPIGLTLPEGEPNSPQALDPAPDSALDTVGIPEAVNDPLRQDQSNSQAKSDGSASEKADGEQGDSESSEGSDAATGDSQSDSQGAKNGKQTGAPNSGEPDHSNSDANSSLMAKLRDAMSNLVSKMRQQNGSGSQHQSNAGQNAAEAGLAARRTAPERRSRRRAAAARRPGIRRRRKPAGGRGRQGRPEPAEHRPAAIAPISRAPTSPAAVSGARTGTRTPNSPSSSPPWARSARSSASARPA